MVATLFAKRFQQLRLSRRLKQKELAVIFHVSRSTIAMWEKKDVEPNYSILIEIANHFSVSADYLLGLSDYPGKPNPEAGKGPYNLGLAGIEQPLTEHEINVMKAVLDAIRLVRK